MFSQPIREQRSSDPARSKTSMVPFGIRSNPITQTQVSGKPTLDDVIGMQMNLHYDIAELKEDVMGLQDEMKTIRELLESHLDVQDEPDNYDMSVEDIKKLIAKECKPGQQYYPGDLAFEHGLNYDAVLEAVASLKEEGRVQS